MTYPSRRPTRRSRAATAVITLFLALFAAGGVFSGCIFVSTLADLLSAQPGAPPLPVLGIGPGPTQATNPPGATAVAGPGSQAQPTPVVDPLAAIPAWQGDDRITILLMGLDFGDDDPNMPRRSDTMILLTVDPVQKRAGMLSIPRDLWVPIPGHGENKINTAHFFGEADKAGGGPALAVRTVEYNFGVRVNYWARVDFHGFEQLIDAIGGITIDVERPIRDDDYPIASESSGQTRRIYIPTGIQHMDGAQALRYARSRHSDNDFGRNRRQQAVLLAARNQVLQPSILPRVPQMVGILRGALSTNVPLTDVLPLFNLGRGIQAKDIVSRSVDSSMVIDVNGDGTVLVPDRRKIRSAIEEIFSDKPSTPTPAPTSVRAAPTATPAPTPTRAAATATPTQTTRVAVRVYNGTLRDGLAARTAEMLRGRGYEIRDIGQASRSDYAATVVLDHTGRSRAAATIAQLLGVPASAVRRDAPATDGSDVTIILGPDARAQ